MIKTLRKKISFFDYYLFIPYLLLSIIGTVMVYSASSISQLYAGGGFDSYLLKQLLFTILGVVVFFIVSYLNQRIWANIMVIEFGYIFLIVLLAYALVFGTAVNGAKGWINLGAFSIQPAELCKVYIAIYVAWFCGMRQKIVNQDIIPTKINFLTRPYILALMMIIMLGLILKAPDTGGFLINFMILFMILLAASNSLKIVLGGLVGLPIAYSILLIILAKTKLGTLMPGYAYGRILSFFDPFKYATETGKQVVNSYYAISNGGLLGQGIGNSIQKRGYLPEAHTDFILAIISEELGAIGVTVVLVLLCWIIMRIFLIGIRSKTIFNALFCYGIGTFFLIETLLNVGAVCGLVPVTGVTLPFISYGGSSMLVLSAALGMVVNISIKQKRKLEFDVLEKKRKKSS